MVDLPVSRVRDGGLDRTEPCARLDRAGEILGLGSSMEAPGSSTLALSSAVMISSTIASAPTSLVMVSNLLPVVPSLQTEVLGLSPVRLSLENARGEAGLSLASAGLSLSKENSKLITSDTRSFLSMEVLSSSMEMLNLPPVVLSSAVVVPCLTSPSSTSCSEISSLSSLKVVPRYSRTCSFFIMR
ncbi:hypothetical protein Bca4012_067525 [Brassica carinata]